MPNALAHVLLAIFAAELIRRLSKKKFKLFYVLVAGIAGLIPDLDIIFYWFVNLFTHAPLYNIHRTFTHTIFLPLIFLVLTLVFIKHKKYFLFFGMVTLGISVHLLLDLTATSLRIFYPFSELRLGLNLIPGGEFGRTILLGFDAILLVSWLIYQYYNHNLKDFV